MHSDKIDYLPNGYFNQLKIINNITFTAREIDVIACVNHMRGSSKIASILNIATRTVETHIANIKLKISNSARDGFIDFIEKSGKTSILKNHYQNLLLLADFHKKLKSVSTLIYNKSPICHLFCSFEKASNLIVDGIKQHLQLAGITLTICTNKTQIVEHKQNEYFIYVISEQDDPESLAYKVLQTSTYISDFLIVEKINPDVAQELQLNEVKCIDFTTQENYFLTFFEILKKLLPNVNLDNIISQIKLYQQSIFDPQILPEFNQTVNLKIANTLNKRWTTIILALILISIIIFGYNKMTSKEYNHDNKADRSCIPTKPYQLTMTNYIPEILTGYEHFIGRTQELQQIDYWLTKDNLVIITGCAGIGKSSLVVEYAKLNKQNKIIHFFVATSKNRLDQQYRELAQELNINVNQQPNNLIMQLVNNKLSTITNKPILFIFDNIDQYDDIKDYFVNLPVNIQVIMNTRQPMLIANKPHLVLDEFNIINAEQYLKSSLIHRNFSNAIIHDIIKNTGTLPYDIKCITAYLLDNPDIDSSTDFKKIGNNIKDQLFQEFALSTDPTTLHAWKILQYASNLDPDFISIDLIKELFPQDFKLSAAALKKLESLSLISIINNQNNQAGFRIHRKLQKNVQNSMQHHAEYTINNQELISNLLGVLDRLFPEIICIPNVKRQIASNLRPHLEKVLTVYTKVVTKKDKITQANLCYKLAIYHLRATINYQQALKYAQIALDQRTVIYTHRQWILVDFAKKIACNFNLRDHTTCYGKIKPYKKSN